MTDKLEQDIKRGQRAQALLADDLMTEAKAHIEAELWRKFQELPPSAKSELEFVKAMQYFHSKYFAFFQMAVIDGKVAQINLDAKKKTLKERMFG